MIHALIVEAMPWEPCHVDDVACILNPVQSADLKQILLMTPPERRLNVAMAFAGIDSLNQLPHLLDLVAAGDPGSTFWRYAMRKYKMPLGIAFRLEKLFGVPISVLCEWYMAKGL